MNNLANTCNVRVSYRKRHTGKFYTGTAVEGPHGVLSIASDDQQNVEHASWMASELVLELQLAVVAKEEGLDPEPEVPVEGANKDGNAAPDNTRPAHWEPIMKNGIIIGWKRAPGGGGSDPPSGASAMEPPVPTPQQQVPATKGHERDEEAVPYSPSSPAPGRSRPLARPPARPPAPLPPR